MGSLYLVTTPIGNLREISEYAIEILNMVDLIACEDTRNSLKLLNHFSIKKKLFSYHKYNESVKSDYIIEQLKSGKNIALISDAGVPSISDPGYVITKKCIINNIDVYAVGINCALINALVVSGFDTKEFSFYGFLPRENKDITKKLEEIRDNNVKVAVIYESPKRIIKTLSKISEVLDNPYVSVCNDLTKKHETKYYGNTLEVIKIIKENINAELGEYVIIIEKNDVKKLEEKSEYTIEAELVNIMFKNNCNLKEAISYLTNNSNYKKNDIYTSSLNLKKLF